ncbi:hypothetical protein Pint_11566 [Pistacia integerrima]|uniref:Uncharacterized protein n=1 Tax=Pistacia integerrima TaxID=434235 RepID=A0ACC0XKR5_9ROSI|nr:hypothetical protein Pint_11566 [Pistacia integerrima]
MSKTIKSGKEAARNLFQLFNKKPQDENQKLKGQSSSQEPSPTTPPEKEPEGDEEEENPKNEGKNSDEAETTEEDKVTGSKRVKTGKSYEIEFNITLKADAFGWNGLPLSLMAKIGAKGKSIWKKIKPLEETGREEKFDIPKPEEKFIVKIPKPEDDKGDEDLFFGLYEIWSNKWKGGLLINYATVKEVSSPN